jgi:hypothetical protein
MGVRAQDDGKSQCRPVMGWIRVYAVAFPARKCADVHLAFHCGKFGRIFVDAKQMTVKLTDASIRVWREKTPVVYRKGYIMLWIASYSQKEWPLKCLSRVRRKVHARFLEGWGLATIPGYPTQRLCPITHTTRCRVRMKSTLTEAIGNIPWFVHGLWLQK